MDVTSVDNSGSVGGVLAASKDAKLNDSSLAPDDCCQHVMANIAWVVDTGSTGYAQREDLQRVPLANPIEVNTANGPAFADHGVVLQAPGMPEYVCDIERLDCHALLSVGRRCMKHG